VVDFGTLEPTLLLWVGVVSLLATLAWAGHYISYHVIKLRTLKERRWDYNICCGTTDAGGINADIVRHSAVPRFELISDVTRLEHPDKTFEHVLCSHTIEHVPDPAAMFRELRRIGKNVTLLVPPLWDFTAALNPFEHQVIFLTLRSRHDNHLPAYIRFAPARWIQGLAGQKINADELAAGGTGSWQRAADYMVPLTFLVAAGLAFKGSVASVICLPLGFAALWASKRKARN
jgi:SAM-dependent methyltransferase